MPLDWAALMSCCIPTGWGTVTKQANVQPGDAVAVWGLGGVGQNTLRAAKMRQANPLIAVDLEEARRDKAMKLGATHFINTSKEDPVPIVQELTGGGLDIIFECSGDPGATVQAYWALRPEREADAGGHHGRARSGSAARSRSWSSGRSPSWASSTAPSPPRTTSRSTCELAMSGDMMLDTIIEGHFKLEEINDIRETDGAARAERPLGLQVRLTVGLEWVRPRMNRWTWQAVPRAWRLFVRRLPWGSLLVRPVVRLPFGVDLGLDLGYLLLGHHLEA